MNELADGTLFRHLDPAGVMASDELANAAPEWKRALNRGCAYLILAGPNKALLERGVVGAVSPS